MGLFDVLFGRLRRPNVSGFYKLLDGYIPAFSTWSGSIYESQLVRAAIEARARHVSKLSVNITGSGKPALQTQLKKAPNDMQTWSQFLARLSTILDVRNTAFIVPGLDRYGEIVGVHTIAPESWELVEADGEPWIRFKFDGGERAAIELRRVGVMTKYQYKSDLFGESNEALKETLDLIKIQTQGIEEAAKNAASYRFMARVSNFSKTDDLKKERERFDEANFKKGGGILLFPNVYTDIKQLNWQNYSVDAKQLELIHGNVYSYFGVNEDVLQNKTIGDAWNAFYEGAVEPFAIQLSEVMTRMIFSPREMGNNNQIFFAANRLQYMSNQDKLQVSAQMTDRGLMTKNEVREIWNLPPVEGGDVFIVRGEYYNADDKTGGENEGS